MTDKQQTAEIAGTSYILFNDGKLYNTKTKKYKLFNKSSNGYMVTQLWINNKSKTVSQHRLLATYFINNPENKSQVNHINGIKHDNRIENLEWATPSENTRHSYKNGLQIGKGVCKKVIDKSTSIIYESVTQAAYKLNMDRSYLSSCLSGAKRNYSNLEYYG